MYKRSFGLFLLAALTAAAADYNIYTDSLQNSWVSWSWSSTINFNNSTPTPHAGSRSISVQITGGWGALYLHHAAMSSVPYSHLRFWIHGGASGGQQLNVRAHLNGAEQTQVELPALAPNSWQLVTISLAALGVADRPNLDGFWIMDATGGAQAVFYVDDIALILLPTATLTAPAPGDSFTAPATMNLAASVAANGHTIDKVEFLNGTSVLGESAAAPYVWNWPNVSHGSYALTARAFYDGGGTVDSPTVSVVVATNSYVTLAVDAQLNRHPIDPLIYGVAFASGTQLADLNAPVNRSGGNSETRYNWVLNAHSTANDWYFESRADSSATPGASAHNLVSSSKSAGAEPMLTIPMIGWAPKLGANRAPLPSFSVAKYGAQAAVDPYWSDAGNGIRQGSSTNITNDPNDANFSTNSTFQFLFLQQLTNQWGHATNGGVRYYCMDNEHTLWHSTHRDVHPAGATMQEVRDKFFDYAGVVKAVDPSALVLAPEEWGWSGYFYSGADQQWSNARRDWNPAHFPDRIANGGWDYIPWLLDQFRRQATNTGQRLLDYCTAHVYPQGGEFADDVSTAMQLKRNRSTRQLWDTNYVDPNWINNVIKLIPRMKGWVDAYYPGTKIGITEYNWGAEAHINGATAQADIYGIFGREGLDLATRWTTPATGTPTYNAMKMFRNYDGLRSGFGETSIAAAAPNPDLVSVFASIRTTDNALTLMVINKQQFANAVATVNFTNQSLSGTGQVWQLNAGNVIRRASDIGFTDNVLTSTVPPQSITLFVLPAGAPPSPPRLRPGGLSGPDTFDLWLEGEPGRYVLQSTTNLTHWTPVQTNTLTSNSLHLFVPATGPRTFYRAQW